MARLLVTPMDKANWQRSLDQLMDQLKQRLPSSPERDACLQRLIEGRMWMLEAPTSFVSDD